MKVWLQRVGGIYGLEIGIEWRCWSITAVVSFPRLYLERSEGGNIVWCNFKQLNAGLCEADAVPMLGTSAQPDAEQQDSADTHPAAL